MSQTTKGVSCNMGERIVEASCSMDLRGLLTFEDPKDTLHADHSEWVQWLMQQIGRNDRLGVWMARGEGDMLLGYLVAIDTVAPPLSRSVTILHLSSVEGWEGRLLERAEGWARGKGAECLEWITQGPSLQHGFHDKGYRVLIKGL